MSEPRTGWDDSRLDAAFAARAAAAPATPPDLAEAAILAAARRRRTLRNTRSWFAAAAAILVAVGIAGVGILVVPHSSGNRHGGDGLPASSVAIALGEPIDVPRALAIRDATRNDRELVVDGFQSGGQPLSCPFDPGDQNPTRLVCPASFAWLMATPEVLVRASGNSVVGGPPTGPAFHASYDIVEPGFANDAERPVEVVVVGHFHDRRAALCPPSEVAACGQTFVVDRVESVNRGPRTITTRRDPGSPIASEDAVDRLVGAAAPGSELLSRQLRTADGLVAAEPALRGDRRFASVKLVWIETVADVRGGEAIPRTFVVVDGTTDLVEMTAAGPVDVSPASPSPSNDPAAQSPGVSNLRGWLMTATIDVATAIDQRDHDLDNREIAVAGWAHGPSGPISCPMIRPGMPVAIQCPSTFTWISQARPPTEPEGVLSAPPQPAFNLLLSRETLTEVSIYDREAVRVIAIGHFDDPRAVLCEADQVATCRRTFVVDAVLDPASSDAAPRIGPDDSGRPLHPVATPDRILSIATLGSRGWASVLSAVAMPGSAMPNIAVHAGDAPELVSAPVVWVVRYLDGFDQGTPTLETRLIIDGPPAALPNQVYVPTPTELLRLAITIN